MWKVRNGNSALADDGNALRKANGVISEKEMLEIFPHPSVREVAFEVRFAPRLRITSEVWRIQDSLAESYPAVSQEMQALDEHQVQAYVFGNPGTGSSIRVSQESFAVVFHQYDSFEEFKDEALRRTDAFAEKFGIQTFHRVGLRYVNHIELGPEQGVEDLKRYVNLPVDFDRFDPASIEQLSTEMRLALDEHKMTIRDELVRRPGNGGGLFVLDLDCHTFAHIEIEDLPLLMDEFHRKIQIQFLEHVREEYKQIMRGGGTQPVAGESENAASTAVASTDGAAADDASEERITIRLEAGDFPGEE